jgi:hypothetical protein
MSSFLDGKPNPDTSLSDQQELSKVMAKHTNSHDAALQQVSIVKQRLLECKEKVQSMHNLVKNAQKNYSLAATLLQKKLALSNGSNLSKSGRSSRQTIAVDDDDRAAFRVKDIIGALRVTADHRRDQSDQKKNTGFSSAWVQSFPGLPSSLKKSLWHKMHRRKQQVILRPTPESLVSDLRTSVAIVTASKYSDRDKMEKIETEMMKAEQLYLLATHPFSTDSLSCVPPTKSSENWSEPGWKINLSVPSDNRDDMILPCTPSFPVLETNLAEIASTPGRQAASMLRTSHFRCLASPLSAFAVASSAAESNSSLPQNRTHAEGDPLHIIDEEILIGYKFNVKPIPPPTKVSQPRRRTSTPKSQLDTEPINDGSSKKSNASASSSGNATRSAEPSTSQAGSDRKKTESKRQRAPSKASDQTSKKAKADNPTVSASTQIPSQPYSPIVQKQQLQQQHQTQAPQPTLQRQATQVHHQQRQHVQQHQHPQLTAQQQRQMHHQVSRHPQSQHHPQLSASQHHQQMPPSQHHQQHIAQQHPHSSQQQYSPQMNQMRMMQQQSQQMQNMSPRHQQVAASYPPQAIQQMQQFYAPLNHPQAPMHMQGRAVAPHPPPPQQQQLPQQGMNNAGQGRKSDDPNDANDPLFMLK